MKDIKVRPMLQFTSGILINQIGLSAFTNVLVYEDGTHELVKCLKDKREDKKVLCHFQIGAYFTGDQ